MLLFLVCIQRLWVVMSSSFIVLARNELVFAPFKAVRLKIKKIKIKKKRERERKKKERKLQKHQTGFVLGDCFAIREGATCIARRKQNQEPLLWAVRSWILRWIIHLLQWISSVSRSVVHKGVQVLFITGTISSSCSIFLVTSFNSDTSNYGGDLGRVGFSRNWELRIGQALRICHAVKLELTNWQQWLLKKERKKEEKKEERNQLHFRITSFRLAVSAETERYIYIYILLHGNMVAWDISLLILMVKTTWLPCVCVCACVWIDFGEWFTHSVYTLILASAPENWPEFALTAWC